MIIVGTFDKCKIGDVVSGTYWTNADEHFLVTFLIVRESNYEEWLEYKRSISSNFDFTPNELVHFYGVTTD